MKLTTLLTLLFFLSGINTGWTQTTSTPMAELMRSDGRIYVVIAVLITILGGLIFYLIRLDNRIKQLEKEN